MAAHRGGLLVSERYRVSDRFRYILLNTADFKGKDLKKIRIRIYNELNFTFNMRA